MKRLIIVPMLLVGCATSRFDSVVRRAVSTSLDDCGGEVAVERLNSWAYRVEACDSTVFYRCFYQRKTVGRTQCCYPVADEDAAAALVSSQSGEQPCAEFVE